MRAALAELGFSLVATRGTAAYLRAHGVECDVIYKVNEGRPSLADEIVNRRIAMVVNTPLGRESFFDDKAVRRAAMMAGIPCITTMTGAAAAVDAIRALRTRRPRRPIAAGLLRCAQPRHAVRRTKGHEGTVRHSDRRLRCHSTSVACAVCCTRQSRG